MKLPDVLRPYLARLIAVPVAALITWATAKYALDLDKKTIEQMTGQIVEILLLIIGQFSALYAVIHRYIGARVNPSDAAAASMASVATGKMGDGERTRLAGVLDRIATGEAIVPEVGAPLPPDASMTELGAARGAPLPPSKIDERGDDV